MRCRPFIRSAGRRHERVPPTPNPVAGGGVTCVAAWAWLGSPNPLTHGPLPDGPSPTASPMHSVVRFGLRVPCCVCGFLPALHSSARAPPPRRRVIDGEWSRDPLTSDDQGRASNRVVSRAGGLTNNNNSTAVPVTRQRETWLPSLLCYPTCCNASQLTTV